LFDAFPATLDDKMGLFVCNVRREIELLANSTKGKLEISLDSVDVGLLYKSQLSEVVIFITETF
jgi:hypothetical protein